MVEDDISGYILVDLKDTPEPAEKNLAAMLGYECLGFYCDVVPAVACADMLYKVPEGEEDGAIRRFEEQNFFVVSAYRRSRSYEHGCLYKKRIESVMSEFFYCANTAEDVLKELYGLACVVKKCIAEEEKVLQEDSEEPKIEDVIND